MEVGEYVPRESMLRSRRQLYALIVFGLLVLLVMALYGWLLYRSLVEREAHELVDRTRVEAEGVARFIEEQVGSGRNASLVMGLAAGPIRPVLELELEAHHGVGGLELRDADGVMLFAARDGTLSSERLEPMVDADGVARVFEVPVGDVGSLLVAIDPVELDRRTDAVRRTIAARASSMMVVVALLFAVGLALVWRDYIASREQLEKAQHTERMAYIGTLAAGLAHEIRSPLNSLSLNMQMLGEEVAEVVPDGSGSRLLDITKGEIDRLERLVTEFLNYARPRPLETEELTARALVDRVVDVVRGGLESRGVEVRIEDSSADALVRVDPAQMHQCLLNLTENAAHATDGIRRPAWIEYILVRHEDTVRIQVHDNGRGMLEEDLEQATEIFFSRRKGGTGLGLAIVDRIVTSHEGRLSIDSEFQVGTTVTVELPLASTRRSRSQGGERRDG